jgi:hypothetical protein
MTGKTRYMPPPLVSKNLISRVKICGCFLGENFAN